MHHQEEELLILLEEAKLCETTNKSKTDAILAGDCLAHTKKNKWLIGKVMYDFLDSLASIPDSKWTNMLEFIPFKGLTGRISAPEILIFVDGMKST